MSSEQVQPGPTLSDPVVRLLQRDRLIVVAALLGLTVLGWLYLVDMSHGDMSGMDMSGTNQAGDPSSAQMAPMDMSGMNMSGMDMAGMDMSGAPAPASRPEGLAASAMMACGGADVGVTFAMWAIMMVGMMLPSAAPMVLMYTGMTRQRSGSAGFYLPTTLFLGGYLAAWTLFSLAAAVLQWALYRSGVLDAESQTVVPWLGGALLIAAGLFQLSPLKTACLAHCRSPMGFLMAHWHGGLGGAFRMGLRHGAACIGCCWLLMALLFAVGVMNLAWVAAVAGVVLLEKVLPWKRAVVAGGAAVCIAGGLAVLMWHP